MADPCRKQFILLRMPAAGSSAAEQPGTAQTAADSTEAVLPAATPAAQLRLDLSGQKAEISYSVAASERGKGLGTLLIQMAVSHARNVSGIRTLTAEVLPDNTASRRIFEKCGFHLLRKEPGKLLYIYNLKGDRWFPRRSRQKPDGGSRIQDRTFSRLVLHRAQAQTGL